MLVSPEIAYYMPTRRLDIYIDNKTSTLPCTIEVKHMRVMRAGQTRWIPVFRFGSPLCLGLDMQTRVGTPFV